MKGYRHVELIAADDAFDHFERGGVTPVAVELGAQVESLVEFVHPDQALYVFGPEDGSLPKPILPTAIASWSSRRIIA